MTDAAGAAGPYRHVADLPSFVEITRELHALRLRRLVLPDARRRTTALQRQVRDLVRRADGFATLLDTRGWTYFDLLAPEIVDAVLAAEGPEDAEDLLVAHLSDAAVIESYVRARRSVLGAAAVSDDPIATAKAWCHLLAVAGRSEVVWW